MPIKMELRLSIILLLIHTCQMATGTGDDYFRCVEPTRNLYEQFISQYNRTFASEADKMERLSLFMNSLKRLIMLNRIVQDASLNQSNLARHPEMGDYHYIVAQGSQVHPLWYADINDCELGLIKNKMSNIMYLIENDNLAEAYRIALDNSKQLPLLSESGFEQLANILIVRLHDRFTDGKHVSQLYRWPIYMKRLASYAYHRRQAAQPDFGQRLALISFAYPAYFKDVKYNLGASNRTGDNLAAHREHERFNKLLGRKFANLMERNKRLVIFRHRWSLVNQLNEPDTGRNDWRAVSLRPDWLQLASGSFLEATDQSLDKAQSQRLVISDDDAQLGAGSRAQSKLLEQNGRYKHTKFSDLTDQEFVGYLNNDRSLLDPDSARYLDTNFDIRVLDDKFKGELAAELELRRALQVASSKDNEANSQRTDGGRESLALARKVIEELISDVGLPIGKSALDNVPESESMKMFEKVAKSYGKNYMAPQNTPSSSGPSESALANERLRRYEEFKFNYARFKAWSTKEGWLDMDETKMVAALRLADMSWHELKLTLFKICCLSSDNLARIGSINATIKYLGSNKFLCQPLTKSEQLYSDLDEGTQTSRQHADPELREQRALELYFVYCLHFNKHHSDMDTFYSRFTIFRYNIDHIRRYSCTRAMTLYPSLLMRRTSSLSQIDSLGPQRSYTDDLNLDRFRYFTIPNLEINRAPNEDEDSESSELFAKGSARNEKLRADSETLQSGYIQRHSFFSKLLSPIERESQPLIPQERNRLLDSVESQTRAAWLDADRYKRNNVAAVYGMVMQHYRLCGETLSNYELKTRTCHSAGQLSEQASSWPDSLLSGRQSLELKQQDPCASYWLGLESWGDGLTKQHPDSVAAILAARCH